MNLMSMMLCLLVDAGAARAGRIVELADAATVAWPRELVRHVDQTGGGPIAHAAAAVAAETTAFPAETLLAIAHLESKFRPDDTSRMTPGGRKTGRWPSTRRGRGFGPSYFCGPLQAKARRWARCVALRDLWTGYAAGVAELARWRKRTRDTDRALAGHGCGNAGLRHGCKKYAKRVRTRETKLWTVIHAQEQRQARPHHADRRRAGP